MPFRILYGVYILYIYILPSRIDQPKAVPKAYNSRTRLHDGFFYHHGRWLSRFQMFENNCLPLKAWRRRQDPVHSQQRPITYVSSWLEESDVPGPIPRRCQFTKTLNPFFVSHWRESAFCKGWKLQSTINMETVRADWNNILILVPSLSIVSGHVVEKEPAKFNVSRIMFIKYSARHILRNSP